MLTCDEIVEELAQHSVQDRVSIIDAVLHSVINADRQIETAWLDEAERRLTAYKDGRCVAISFDQVMAKYRKSA